MGVASGRYGRDDVGSSSSSRPSDSSSPSPPPPVERTEEKVKVTTSLPKPIESPYSAKYYEMSDATKQEFWMRPSSPPEKVQVYPVGHAKNLGVQHVWKATPREIKYFEAQRYVVNTVPFEQVCKAKDGNSYNVTRANMIYNGKFILRFEGIQVESMFLEDKMKHLEAVVQQHGTSFWIRMCDSFGSSIAKLLMSYACAKTAQRWSNVLMLCGSNFQGAACVAAARYLASFKMNVSVVCVQSEVTEGSGERFHGSDWADLKYENIKVVFDLSAIKQKKFNYVVFGVDDHDSPSSSLHVYRNWIRGASVFLIDPPLINESYRQLLEDMCYKQVGHTVVVNSIRPTPSVMQEDIARVVVNIPTSIEYPAIGKMRHYNDVIPSHMAKRFSF